MVQPNRVSQYCPECKTHCDLIFPYHFCVTKNERGEVDVTSKRWDARLGVWVLDESPEEKSKRTQEEAAKKVVLQSAVSKKSRQGDVRDTGHYYDAKLNAWVDVATGIIIPDESEKKEKEKETKTPDAGPTLQSCELHPSQKKEEKEKTTEHDKKCICDKCKPIALRSHEASCRCYQCWQWKKEKGIATELHWPGYQNHYPTSGSIYTPTNPYGSNWKPCMPWEGLEYKKWPNTFMFLMSYYWVGNRWYEGRHISDADYRERIVNGVYKPEAKARSWQYGEGDYDGA